MTKIEEILCKNFGVEFTSIYDFDSGLSSTIEYEVHRTEKLPERLRTSIEQYAEFYAQRCLEIAAKEASANFECIGAVLGAENVNPYVEEESILKIKLPEHD